MDLEKSGSTIIQVFHKLSLMQNKKPSQLHGKTISGTIQVISVEALQPKDGEEVLCFLSMKYSFTLSIGEAKASYELMFTNVDGSAIINSNKPVSFS